MNFEVIVLICIIFLQKTEIFIQNNPIITVLVIKKLCNNEARRHRKNYTCFCSWLGQLLCQEAKPRPSSSEASGGL